MDKYEENILRLNRKIRDLITQIDTLEIKNRKLQQENGVLVEDVANFRVQYAHAEEGRVRIKAVLEKEIARNNEQYEAQALLKKRYNDLIQEYVAQHEKLKTCERNASLKQRRSKRKHVPVEIIGKPSDVVKPTVVEERVKSLEHRCKTLEKELYKAYDTIDDLEFELESIDHLEDSNQRLERQVSCLKAKLEQYRQYPLTPDSANSATFPLRQPPFYPIEITETAQQDSTQDGQEKPKAAKPEEPTNIPEGNFDHKWDTTVLESNRSLRRTRGSDTEKAQSHKHET